MRKFMTIFIATTAFGIFLYVMQKSEFVTTHIIQKNADANIPESKTESLTFHTVMDVPPTEMYKTYQAQYRLKPDTRFINAFKMLINIYTQYSGLTDDNNPFSIGEIQLSENHVTVSLLKKQKPVKTITLSLPVTIPDQMDAMLQILDTMGVVENKKEARPHRGTYWSGNLSSAIDDFNKIDSRSVIQGMLKLEALRNAESNDSRLFIAAARGYSMMLMGLEPDHMQYKDRFASKALAFLAFAKKIDPEISAERVEAILATNMGYTAYANMLQSRIPDSDKSIDKSLEAYIEKDLKTLENCKGEGSNVLAYYLLSRLYRQLGLHESAKKEAGKLIERLPDNFPVMVETINSAELNNVKRLTALYPMFILRNIAEEKTSKPDDIKNIFYTLKEGLNNRIISFSSFEDMLSNHTPPVGTTDYGFFINDEDIDSIYRALYSCSVYLRFNLLLNKWSIVAEAEKFVGFFRKHDPNHPLVMEMAAEVLKETGKKKEAEEMFVRVIKHPDASPKLALKAHAFLDDYSLTQRRFTPVTSSRLDGCPACLAGMGKMFYRQLHYDLAEKYYRMKIQHDPYSFYAYYYMSIITGSATPVESALKQFPGNLAMLKVAGDYYLTKDDPVSIESAYRCFRKAVLSAPFSSSHVSRLADTLIKMKRYDEAINVLSKWIDNYGSMNLDTTKKWGRIADIYLKMKKPVSAAEILIDNSETYWLLRFYLENNKMAEAISMINGNIDTYYKAYKKLQAGQYNKSVNILTGYIYHDVYELLGNYIREKKYYSRLNYYINDETAFEKVVSKLKNGDQTSAMETVINTIKIKQRSDNNLDTLMISCIDSGEHTYALTILERTLSRYRKVVAMLESQEISNALSLVSKNLDDYHGGIIVHTARAYEELNQLELAGKTLNKGLERHFTSGYMFSKAAAFMWRNGKYEDAAEFILKGSKNKGKHSRWFFKDFFEVFSNQPDDHIMNAIDSLVEKDVDHGQITSIGYQFFHKGRPETAYKIISKRPANDMMSKLEKTADRYLLLKVLKGEHKAYQYIEKTIRGNTRSIFSMVLFSEGLYELAYEIIGDPDSYSRHREFVWLQKLMAWTAIGKTPGEVAHEFNAHYSSGSSDYYHAIGSYILEKTSLKDLLKLAKTPKQRCEISYYIGFTERMKGNFKEAANWYQICMETLLENNGEYHWASNEMFWWAHMGTKGRHSLLTDDRKEYYKRRND